MKSYRNFLNENSMSRILSHISKHDCACITAFRYASNCGQGTPYTLQENKARNKKLQAQLTMKGYGLTKIKGIYIENYGQGKDSEHEVSEETFFVVNLKNNKDFKQNILNLGKEYEQDSILYIPENETDRQGNINVYLISTNECPSGYPGMGKLNVEEKFSKIKPGSISQFMSKVGNKPFYFTESLDDKKIDIIFQGNFMSGMGLQSVANSDWEKLIED